MSFTFPRALVFRIELGSPDGLQKDVEFSAFFARNHNFLCSHFSNNTLLYRGYCLVVRSFLTTFDANDTHLLQIHFQLTRHNVKLQVVLSLDSGPFCKHADLQHVSSFFYCPALDLCNRDRCSRRIFWIHR